MSTDGVWVEDPTAPNNGPKVNTAVWCLFGFATVFLALRIYCKFKRHRGLWWDDHVLIASWVCFLVAAIQLSVNIAYGFGKPGANINPEHSYQVGLGGLIVGTMILIAPIWSKTSFALTLTKVSGPRLNVALWISMALMNVFQAVSIVIQWVHCTPVERVWNPFLEEGDCLPLEVNLGISMASAAFSGVMDLAFAAVPWIILKDLQIKKKEKLGIALAMSLGVVAGATAFVKCAKQKLLASSDFTLEGGELIIWAATEIAATTIAACVPVLRTLVMEASTARGTAPSGGYFKSGSGIDRDRISRAVPGGSEGSRVTSVLAIRKGNITTTGDMSPDAASDKSILEPGSGNILKTDVIAITYGDRDTDERSPGYEMQDLQRPNPNHR